MLEWTEEPLAVEHDCRAFESGEPEIDKYLQRYALRNQRLGVSRTFVAVLPDEPHVVQGYYTIAAAQVPFATLPEEIKGRLPRYPAPAFRLARLGVTRSRQGQHLGQDLVFAAGMRAREAATSVGGVFLLIDAMTDDLVDWYRRYFGAVPLLDVERTVVVSLDLFASAIDQA